MWMLLFFRVRGENTKIVKIEELMHKFFYKCVYLQCQIIINQIIINPKQNKVL